MHPFIAASIVTFAIVVPISAIIGFRKKGKKVDTDKFQGGFWGAIIGLILACIIIGFLGVTCVFCY